MKKEQNSALKHPSSLLPSKLAEMVLDFLEPGVGRGGTSLPWGDKPRAKAGPVNGESLWLQGQGDIWE